MSRTARTAIAIMASVVLLSACSSGPSAGPVSATVKEWQIDLSSTTLKAGSLTFNIKNAGDKEHEFIIRKTDLKSDKLPLNEAGEVIEAAPELAEVGDPSEVGEIASGSSDRTITLNLQPGHYVIFCNLHVDDLLHYQKGMHIDFTVE